MQYDLEGVKVELPEPDENGDAQYWIAPGAHVIGRVKLARNSSVWFNSVVRGDTELISIGEGSNIQDGSVVHADLGVPTTIGADVTVGHMAMLHGCNVGDRSLIGIGALVMNHAQIGKECIIGAKSLVGEGKKIPDRSLVMGVPGKIIREVTDEEAQFLKISADGYVANWKRFAKGLESL